MNIILPLLPSGGRGLPKLGEEWGWRGDSQTPEGSRCLQLGLCPDIAPEGPSCSCRVGQNYSTQVLEVRWECGCDSLIRVRGRREKTS